MRSARQLLASLDDRKVERAQSGLELGASVRVVAGEATYFGHVDGLGEGDLERVAGRGRRRRARRGDDTAPAAARVERPAGQCDRAAARRTSRPSARPRCWSSATSARAVRASDVAQVTAGYNEQRRQVQLANSDGLSTGDDRTRLRLGAQVVARSGDRVEAGSESLAGHAGFELFEGDPARSPTRPPGAR